MLRTLVALLIVAAAGCSQPTRTPRPRVTPAEVAVHADASAGLAPLDEPSAFVNLTVPGYGDAVLVVPVGASTPRPVVVVGHGNYDRPEWECHTWRYITHDSAFVLCPRGIQRRDTPPADTPRFTYLGAAALAAEANAGLVALRERYPGYVAGGSVVYAGFSLGAILGPDVSVRLEPGVSHVALVEGGYDAWTTGRARTFHTRGGAHVLFACGQSVNAAAARRAVTRIAGARVETQVIYAPRAGHSYGGGLAPMLREAFAALVHDDPRFES